MMIRVLGTNKNHEAWMSKIMAFPFRQCGPQFYRLEPPPRNETPAPLVGRGPRCSLRKLFSPKLQARRGRSSASGQCRRSPSEFDMGSVGKIGSDPLSPEFISEPARSLYEKEVIAKER